MELIGAFRHKPGNRRQSSRELTCCGLEVHAGDWRVNRPSLYLPRGSRKAESEIQRQIDREASWRDLRFARRNSASSTKLELKSRVEGFAKQLPTQLRLRIMNDCRSRGWGPGDGPFGFWTFDHHTTHSTY